MQAKLQNNIYTRNKSEKTDREGEVYPSEQGGAEYRQYKWRI